MAHPPEDPPAADPAAPAGDAAADPATDPAVDIGGLLLTRLVVGPMANDAYLLADPATGALVLVDAAAEHERLLAVLGGRPLAAVVTTHRHGDHTGALAAVVRATGAEVVAGEPDADALPVGADRRVVDGDEVWVGRVPLRVVRLTGHTPGGIALVHDGRAQAAPAHGAATVHVLTGDSLFPGGVGRTTSPSDFTRLLDDVTAQLFDRYPDDAVVWPGHGEPTTLGAERPQLSGWRHRGW